MPIPITMPRLSDTMEAGTIIKWNVQEGDTVSSGDPVADIETDKATMEMQVYDDGTIARILVGEGKSVGVGTTIAVLAEKGEDPKEVAREFKADGAERPAAASDEKRQARVERPPSDSAQAPTASVAPKVPAAGEAAEASPVDRMQDQFPPEEAGRHEPEESTRDGRRRVSPVARRLADEHGINIRAIQGSGPGGRVIKRDIEQAIEAGQETAAAIAPSARRIEATPVARAPQPAASLALGAGAIEPRRVPLSNMRQVIARRLVESKTSIPHYQVTMRFNMDPLLELRETLNEQLEPQGVKLSVNDFLIRACALAIHAHPEFNASWADDALEVHGEVNVGVAISLPSERGGGLVVATIRNADIKGLRQISLEARQLAEKARTRGLSLDEMADSTFTISNLGMFGVDNFTAIINPPNSAILAVGAAIQQPVVRNGELTVGHEMSGTLSLDHRVIDGALAARYLQTLKELVENPATLLV